MIASGFSQHTDFLGITIADRKIERWKDNKKDRNLIDPEENKGI